MEITLNALRPVAGGMLRFLVILLISNHQNLEVQRITSHQKQRILYALTDLPESEVTCTSWKNFQSKLKNNSSQREQRDYYIIVLDKTTKRVYLQSLKSLQKLTSNGNNLPFQIKWKDNTEPVERTYLQSYDFLINTYKESVTKKIMSHEGYDEL